MASPDSEVQALVEDLSAELVRSVLVDDASLRLVAYEFVDEPNRLHFYVVGVHRDARGILSYDVAVRSLDGSGPHRRGVALERGKESVDGQAVTCSFTLHNTGRTAAIDAAHPEDVSAYVGSDVYRLRVESSRAAAARRRRCRTCSPLIGRSWVCLFVAAALGGCGAAADGRTLTVKLEVRDGELRAPGEACAGSVAVVPVGGDDVAGRRRAPSAVR